MLTIAGHANAAKKQPSSKSDLVHPEHRLDVFGGRQGNLAGVPAGSRLSGRPTSFETPQFDDRRAEAQFRPANAETLFVRSET